MVFNKKTEIRKVTGITNEEEQRIIDFLQGAVYCWCKNNPSAWFSMRDLMGGLNDYWEKTPLNALLKKHLNKGKEKKTLLDNASIDSGWLLKKVIDLDEKLFDTKEDEERIRKYKMIN